MHEHLATEEYLAKTRDVVTFLKHVYTHSLPMTATIITAQAEGNTETLLDILGIIKGRCEDWIEELKEMEE